MIATAIREVASELIDALVRAMARVAGGLSRACAMLGIAMPGAGCEQSSEQAVEKPAVAAVEKMDPVDLVEAITRSARIEARELGEFHLTFYYVVGEDEVVEPTKRHEQAQVALPGTDVAVLAAAGDEPMRAVTLFSKQNCRALAQVSPAFASQVSIQGTGKLRDGRIINVAGKCRCEHSPCFKVTGTKWGTAGNGRALEPFRTAAVDPRVVKLGSLLYIPALDGKTMPGRAPQGGFKHDGCLGADDVGGGIDGRQIDLFVGKRAYYVGLAKSRGGSHSWSRHLKVTDGKRICERKDGRVRKRALAGAGAI